MSDTSPDLDWPLSGIGCFAGFSVAATGLRHAATAPRTPGNAGPDREAVGTVPSRNAQPAGPSHTPARQAPDEQAGLRALLRANAVVASDLSLQVVLRHIVTAAQELVGARYAALGVIASDGTMEQFVQAGISPAAVEQIGQLPRGHGILGLLIKNPEPLRLAELSSHPGSIGLPPHHPPMGSFLGVPIRVRDQVFGNLYLTESDQGQFSAEDESLVTALAATAGVAIENARLHERTERQRHWLAASAEVTKALFAGTSEEPLRVVLTHAALGAGAENAAMMMPTGDGRIRVEAGVGLAVGQLIGAVLDLDTTIAGRAIQTGKPVLSNEGDTLLDDLVGSYPGSAMAGRVVAVPLLAEQDTVLGAILVARTPDRARFTEADVLQLADFAGHAGVALALDSARAHRDVARTLADHDRIAADLHDQVIQQLFATGMGLQGMVHAASADQQPRLLGYVESLDTAIRCIRGTIFSLSHPASREGTLLQQLFRVLEEERAALAFAPSMELAGTLDLSVPSDLGDDVVAVVREALSNIARHANASATHIRIVLHEDVLVLDITDNGDGISKHSSPSGLTNLRCRAQHHGGELTIEALPEGGTQLHWTAHLRAGADR